MSAAKLYQKHSQAELLALQKKIEEDPANHLPAGSIFRLTSTARKKLDQIAQAITFHLADKRAAAGNPVPISGYSGRQTNRR